MRLDAVTLKNFRCYENETTLHLDDLTTLVGRNDAGKSALLEALEIFFNNEIVKAEPGDACVHTGTSFVSITCEFSGLPASLTLDAGAVTTLRGEYLLSATGTLKIKKVFDCGKSKPSADVYVVAVHPSAPGVDALLELKEKELQAIVKSRGLPASLKGNPGMRKAIWDAEPDLLLSERDIQVSRAKEDCKRIWDQLDSHLPLFALFQSDRRSQDSDDEVQNPMKAAVATAIAEVQGEIAQIQQKISEKTRAIAEQTLVALTSLDAGLAKELSPQFSDPTPAKWAGLFSVTMATEHGIPLNKRGSGVRRLILVSFFKAEAERRMARTNKRSIIYAFEEPETSQHPRNQRVLIEAFKDLTSEPGCQVLLTTHSPGLAADLPSGGIRFVTDMEGRPAILAGTDVFGSVAESLGVTPDSRVKVLICVEGPTDVIALKCLSKALSDRDGSLPDLSADPRVAFVLLGGSTLHHWVAENYLRGIGKPEVHIYDSDVPSNREAVDAVNLRTDGSWGALTRKYEIESYLHSQAILEAFNVEVEVLDRPDSGEEATPRCFAKTYSAAQKFDGVMKDTRAKKLLAERAFPRMTAALLQQRDPDGEVEDWFRRIGTMLSKDASHS